MKARDQSFTFFSVRTDLFSKDYDGEVKDGAAWKMNFPHDFLVRRYNEQFSFRKSSYL